ncbi:MAG: hypothetical protein ACHQ17_03050, partial [Polyangia bacterium]
MTFFGRPATEEHKALVHESPISMTSVLMVLAAASILVGLFGIPTMWLHRAPVLEQWLEPVTNMSDYWLSGARAFGENHLLEIVLMCVSVGVAALGWFVARMLYFDLAATDRKLAELKAGYA